MNHTINVLLEGLKAGFQEVLLLSAMASLLALVVLILRRLLQPLIRPGWMYLLWLPLFLRLLIPWSPESPMSLYGWLPQSWSNVLNTGQTTQADPGQPLANAPKETEPKASNAVQTVPFPAIVQNLDGSEQPKTFANPGNVYSEAQHISGSVHLDGWSAAALIWLTGALAWIITGCTAGTGFKRRLRRDSNLMLPDRNHVLELIEFCRERLALRRSPRLIFTEAVSVPTVFGVFRPLLLLPPGLISSLDPQHLRHVLLHELSHIKRRDIAVNILAALLSALHWFNPLLAFAFRKLREDQETACDEMALGRLPVEERREYGLTLIALLERGAAPVKLSGASSLWSSRKEMHRRMTMIAKYRKPTRQSLVGGTLAVLLLGGCAMTGPATQNKASDPEPASTAASTEMPASQSINEASNGASAEPPSNKRLSQRVEVPAVGEEGYKLSAYDDLSVHVSKGTDPDHPIRSRFTIRKEKGTAVSYVWNYEPEGGTKSVLISRTDLNGDGKEEILLIVPTGSGTELSLQEAHVLDGETLDEIPVEDPVAHLQQAMKSSIVQQNGAAILNAELNGTHVTKRYKDIGSGKHIFDQVGFGAIDYYALAGDALTARLEGRAGVVEFPLTVIVTYDKDLSIAETKVIANGGLGYTDTELPAAIAQRIGIEDPQAAEGWNVSGDNGVYRIGVPASSESSGQGSSYGVNASTGTVFDGTSGSPILTLARISGEESGIDTEGLMSSDGTVYLAALDKRLRFLAENAGWTPIGDDWIDGFDGDGNVLCRVEWNGRQILVKVDVFTGLWSETQ
ncbi:M56 family metallopeptidase [Saccharibacillus deserti]|uniref:M56 family metallopeptidase n=1 Tax=Saccharibacillus deserti TaxID=1634444 RepID=UPI00155752CE|nr:M56 family metallopeptidase [Saccharibacillus deserti]